MNTGSHTPTQLIRLLPDLDAKYQKAEQHVQDALVALREAREAAAAAKRELVSALSQLVKRYPTDVVQEALTFVDNGLSIVRVSDATPPINTPDLLVAEQ